MSNSLTADYGTITYRWEFEEGPTLGYGHVNEFASHSPGFVKYGPMSREEAVHFVHSRKQAITDIHERVREKLREFPHAER